MRQTLFEGFKCVAVSALFFFFVSSVAANDWSDCNSPDIRLRMDGCTRVIQQGEQQTAKILATAYNNRGLAYNQLGQYNRAIADFDQAIKLNPLALFFSNRGNSWRYSGDIGRALADLNRAIQLNPNQAAFYSSRGGTLREKGELDNAIIDFNKAISLAPTQALPYVGRGLTWRAKGEMDRAIADYDQAIRLNPTLYPPYVGRGLAYEGKGNIERARADYKTAISLPRNVVVSRDAKQWWVQSTDDRLINTARTRLALLSEVGKISSDSAPAPRVSPPSEKLRPLDLGRRIALVIGNGAYVNTTALANPPNDAHAVTKNLRSMGFEVSEGVDVDRVSMQNLLHKFLRDAATARLAILFYAGHGIQIDGRNYLLPIDFNLESAVKLAGDMTEVDTILTGLDDQIRTNIVILDACRNNPLAQQAVTQSGPARSITVRSGLAAPSGLGPGATLGAGTLIAFATAPGQVALDGEGVNSPFTTALLRHIPTPGLELQAMLTRVRAEVVAATRSKQVPWSNSSLLGEVYLASKP